MEQRERERVIFKSAPEVDSLEGKDRPPRPHRESPSPQVLVMRRYEHNRFFEILEQKLER